MDYKVLEKFDIDIEITNLEKKLKLNKLENQIKLQNNNLRKNISITISCVSMFFIALFFTTSYFNSIGLDSNLSSLYGLISGSIVSYLILLSIGKIKEFSFKGGTLEISAKLNEEISLIKSEVKESKKEIEGVNKQLQQIQNLVLTSIMNNNIHINNVYETGKEKNDNTSKRLKTIGVSEDKPKDLKLSTNEQQKITTEIYESEAYDKVVKNITGRSLTTPQDKLLHANFFLSTNQFTKSIELCDELLNDGYKNSRVLNTKASALSELGNHKAAIDILKDALDIVPEDPITLNNIGLCYHYIGDFVNARKYYEKSSQIIRDARVVTNLAVTYYYNNDVDTFSKLLEEASILDPTETYMLLWKAIYKIDKGDYDEALTLLDNLLSNNPNFLAGKSNKGLALVLKGDRDSGLELLHAVFHEDPSGTHGMYQMARAQAFLQNHDSALFYLKKAIDLGPSRKTRTKIDPLFDFLKNDKEFKKILEI
jgi:tetratricopeptide (TPR) repeat protein